MERLQGNATLERLQALTRRTGVTVAGVDALRAGLRPQGLGQGGPGGQGGQGGASRTPEEEEELSNAKLSVQLREVFAGRFTAMFSDYEAFVIHSPDLESWLSSREHMHNFDKVTRAHTQTHTHTHTHAYRYGRAHAHAQKQTYAHL